MKKRGRRGSFKATGTRSKFESTLQSDLTKKGVSFEYESEVLEYEDTVKQGYCSDCGSRKVHQKRKYTPDFVIKRKDGTKLYVEAKGYFKSTDRSKMRGVLKSHPDIDLRMVFMTDGKIDKETRYSDWCEKFGVEYHVGKEIPNDWL